MIIEAMVAHERELAAQAEGIEPEQEPVPAKRQQLEVQRKDLVGRRHALARTVGSLHNLARKNSGVIQARDQLAELAADLDAEAEAASEGRAELERRADLVRNGWGRFGATASIEPPLWLAQTLPAVDFHRFRNLTAVEEKLAVTRQSWLATLSDLKKAGDLPEETSKGSPTTRGRSCTSAPSSTASTSTLRSGTGWRSSSACSKLNTTGPRSWRLRGIRGRCGRRRR